MLLAHAGPAGWSSELLAALGLATIVTLYTWGLTRLWRSAGVGHGIRRWQPGSFAAAIAVLGVALLSPIAAISEELLGVHMVQHMLLMLVAAPLMVASSPARVCVWALPRRWRVALARAWAGLRLSSHPRRLAWHPVVAWLSFALVLWIWHLPRLYQAALQQPRVHDLQHLAFFAASCLYWRILFDTVGRPRSPIGSRLGPVTVVVYVFTTSLHGMLLGVLLALSPRLWYPIYAGTSGPWGLSAIEDQQIAGFIMWMPACALYAAIAVGVLAVWLHRAERDSG